jgi:aminoglycoside 3-N-acetyltransferase
MTIKKGILQGAIVTKERIVQDLKQLGLKKGMTIIVHSSLSSLGWVCGREKAVIDAIMEVITEEGTIIMPAQSADNSDPQYWQNPPVPRDWWETIRNSLPPFDPATTPTWGIGRIAEAFRTYPSVLRSAHPIHSFSGWGKEASTVLASHPLDFSLGDESPLGRLYERDSYILLLGVGYDSCTAMHLAEHKLPNRKIVTQSSAILENGHRVWKTYQLIEMDDEQFPAIGEAFEKKASISVGKVGCAKAKLVPLRPLVDFTFEYLMNKHT